MEECINSSGLRPEFCSHSARVMSFKTKKSLPKASRWPHPLSFPLSPETLASAGYFHDPATNEPDRTTCWMCGESMKGWAEEDDPWNLHLQWSPKCPFARIALLEHERDTQNPSWSDSLTHSWGTADEWFPRGSVLIESRLATFCGPNGPWKHEGKKGVPTRLELARAGFHFTPNLFKKGRKFDVDDTTSCCYCHRSVTEWEVDDDPVSVHLKKGACIFFTATQPVGTTKKSSAKPSRKPSKNLNNVSKALLDPLPPTAGKSANASTHPEDRITNGSPEESIALAPSPNPPSLVETENLAETIRKPSNKHSKKPTKNTSSVIKDLLDPLPMASESGRESARPEDVTPPETREDSVAQASRKHPTSSVESENPLDTTRKSNTKAAKKLTKKPSNVSRQLLDPIPIAGQSGSGPGRPEDTMKSRSPEESDAQALPQDPTNLTETEKLLREYLGRPEQSPIADGWLPNPYNPTRPFPPLTAEEAKMPLSEYFAYRANQEEEAFLEWVEEKQMKPWLEAVEKAKELLESLILTRQSSRRRSCSKTRKKGFSGSLVDKENNYSNK